MNNAKLEDTKVKALVVSSQTKHIKVNGKKNPCHEVVVIYKGRSYDINNVYSAPPYVAGRKTTAYLAKGKLYANEARVRASTPLAIVYFIFLFGTVGLAFGTSMYDCTTHKESMENQSEQSFNR